VHAWEATELVLMVFVFFACFDWASLTQGHTLQDKIKILQEVQVGQ
jgi:hypothetical protein